MTKQKQIVETAISIANELFEAGREHPPGDIPGVPLPVLSVEMAYNARVQIAAALIVRGHLRKL